MLPPPLNQSAKFDFVIGLSNLRRWSHDFAKSRVDLRIDRIGLGVLADSFSEVASSAVQIICGVIGHSRSAEVPPETAPYFTGITPTVC